MITRVNFFVAGVGYGEYRKVASAIKIGDEVILKQAPTNLYDKYAIEIWHKDTNVKIGFVPKGVDQIRINNAFEVKDNIIKGNILEYNKHNKPYNMIRVEVAIIKSMLMPIIYERKN